MQRVARYLLNSPLSDKRILRSTAETREMAAKRVAVKAIDWVKLGSTIPKAAAADFNAFRARHETIKGRYSILKNVFTFFL